MKVLMVLTSHDELGDTGEKTGFWLEEFVAPYYVLKDAGADITLASPKGGQPPLDPKSDTDDAQTEDTRRFKDDKAAQEHLANTKTLDEIEPDQFDAIFYPGGHGPLWDLTESDRNRQILEFFVGTAKPIGAVCHAPGIFKHVKGADGEHFVRGKRVTAFSNSEEEAVGLKDVVPFLLEDMLQERGAQYEKGEDWGEFTVVDGFLVTGQNPASSKKAAQELLSMQKTAQAA